METRRLRRIKPQPVPDRRLLWLRRSLRLSRPQSEQEEITATLAMLDHERICRWPLLPHKSVGSVILLVALFWSGSMARFGAPLILLTTASMALFSSLLLTRLVVSQRQLWAVQRLTGSDDLRAIPPLSVAMNWPEVTARNAAAVALIRLLPRLQPADVSLLDLPTRSRLLRRLSRAQTPQQQELAVAILQALEQTGDACDLHCIQALADRPIHTEAEQRLQRAAQSCLLGINRRLGAQMETDAIPNSSCGGGIATVSLPATSDFMEECKEVMLRAGSVGGNQGQER